MVVVVGVEPLEPPDDPFARVVTVVTIVAIVWFVLVVPCVTSDDDVRLLIELKVPVGSIFVVTVLFRLELEFPTVLVLPDEVPVISGLAEVICESWVVTKFVVLIFCCDEVCGVVVVPFAVAPRVDPEVEEVEDPAECPLLAVVLGVIFTPEVVVPE